MFKAIHRRNVAAVLAVGVACGGGASAYAFTASNTVAAHTAGAGSAVVSAYTVSSPTNYTFSADGTTVTAISFQLNAAATDVAAAISAAAPVNADWVDCGASSGGTNDVTCDFSGQPVANGSALKLSVAAVSSGTVTIAP